MDIVQVFTESAKGGWGLYKAKWRALLPLMGLLFAAAVLMNLLGAMPNTSNPALVAGEFAIMLIIVLVILAAGFAALNCVNEIYAGKEKPALGYFGENLAPAIKYALFSLALVAAFAVVGVALLAGVLAAGGISLLALASAGNAGSALASISGILFAGLIIAVPLILIYAIIGFFIQFAQYEMAAGRKGLIEALRGSIELVKTNLLLVFINGILFAVLFIAIAVPYIVLSLIGGVISAITTIMIYGAAALTRGSGPGIISALLDVVFQLPGYAYLYAVQVPLQYAILVKYWRILRGADRI